MIWVLSILSLLIALAAFVLVLFKDRANMSALVYLYDLIEKIVDAIASPVLPANTDPDMTEAQREAELEAMR